MCLVVCGSLAHSQANDEVPSLLGTNVFRGSSWQDTKGTVKRRETANLKFENDSILQYELFLDKARAIEVTYIFTSLGSLKRIETATLFENVQQEMDFQKAIAAFFTEKLGEPNQHKKGTLTWEHVVQYYKVALLSLHDQEDYGTEIVYTPN